MAGRPRNVDGDRHACGKIVQHPSAPDISGTLEKRIVLVGRDKAQDQRAGYPLGILRLRGLLTEADFDAAMRFSALYAVCWGKGSIKSHLAAYLPAAAAPEISESKLLELASELGEATAALHQLGTRRPYHIMLNIGPFERPMRFMDTARSRSPAAWAADNRDLEALQEATHELVSVWKRVDREKAAARAVAKRAAD